MSARVPPPRSNGRRRSHDEIGPATAARAPSCAPHGTANGSAHGCGSIEEAEQWVAAVQSLPDGIFVTDADGIFHSVNPAFEALTGYTAAELAGRHVSLLEDDQTSGQKYNELWQAVRRAARWQGEIPIRSKDGRLFSAHLVLAPVRGDRGTIAGVVGSVRDIPDLKELDRMKTQFISTVTHELRTPVAAIKLHTENLLEFFDQMSHEQRQVFLADIKVETDTLAQLIEDILNLARLDAGSFEPRRATFDIVPLVRELLAQMMPLAREARVRLELASAAPAIAVTADRSQIKNVLRNLVGNAIKFTPPGGQVLCRVWTEDGRLILTVSDTGRGIPERELAHIFEQFYRGSQAVAEQIPGSGLGLAIVRQIVEAHGGTIAVASREGGGTTFTVSLPREGIRAP